MARSKRAAPREDSSSIEKGIVVATHGRRYRVELACGEALDCMSRGKRSDAACGDHVSIARAGDGVGVIERIEPRRTLFYRSDARRQKLIAANVSQIIIVTAVEPRFSEDLVNRCLVGAEHAGIRAIIVLNKVDLPGAQSVLESLELYKRLDYPVVPLQAKYDITPLKAHLLQHTSVLVGQSGMGKSTLVNALAPGAAARVSEISTALGTGRHTTTHAELYHVDTGSAIIDSPGLQEFGLHHLTPDDAANAFVEFRPFLGQCRFRDCRHVGEPGCAISAALERRDIRRERFASYARLAAELARKRPAWEV
jgi:ribosome biogenesis GTPase